MNVTGPTLAANNADLSAELARMRAAGVKAARVPVDWSLVQPERGSKKDLWWLDRFALQAARVGIEVVPVVYGAPVWAAASAQCSRCPANLRVSARQPRDPRLFAGFLAVLAKRYGPKGSLWRGVRPAERRPVTAWQIWNEPDLPTYWQSDKWAAEYGRLLRVSRAALRRADRKATIVLAGLTNRSFDSLVELLVEGRVSLSFNAAAINLFTATPSDQEVVVKRFRQVLDSAGLGTRPIWITEWTWLAEADPAWWGFPPVLESDSRNSAIGATLDRYRQMGQDGTRLRRAFWYSWASSYEGREPFAYSGLNRFDGAPGLSSPMPAQGAWSAWFSSVGV